MKPDDLPLREGGVLWLGDQAWRLGAIASVRVSPSVVVVPVSQIGEVASWVVQIMLMGDPTDAWRTIACFTVVDRLGSRAEERARAFASDIARMLP